MKKSKSPDLPAAPYAGWAWLGKYWDACGDWCSLAEATAGMVPFRAQFAHTCLKPLAEGEPVGGPFDGERDRLRESERREGRILMAKKG